MSALFATLSLLLAAACSAHPPEEEAGSIADLLRLRPGMAVADVGAGDGEWGEALARALDGSGHVYLTEIDDDELRKLRDRVDGSELDNMSVVEGFADRTGLPEACCDAMLLRFVYHHMSDRLAMRSSIKRSLRPGALLLIVEIDDDGHGIETERLVGEMTADGFTLVSRHPQWGGDLEDYAVLFRR